MGGDQIDPVQRGFRKRQKGEPKHYMANSDSIGFIEEIEISCIG